MVNPVNLNNPGKNLNPNSALPLNNGTNPAKVNNAAFEGAIVQAQGQGNAPANGKIVQPEEAGNGAGVHGHHHHGGGNPQYLNGIANLGLLNPQSSTNNNTQNAATSDLVTNNDEAILDTLA
jgi:hypothetical protein